VNAVSGTPWDEGLKVSPQNYLVCPDQPWLDGINAGGGIVRQFVAMPLGTGATVEGQVTGAEEHGGLQLRAHEPKPGRFPDRPPPEPGRTESGRPLAFAAAGTMGLGAGGRMQQRIYPDPYGIETWDPRTYGAVWVHIVNSTQYRAITGREPPPTPVSAQTYTEYGFPWFALYDEHRGDVPASERLAQVESLREREAGRGAEDTANQSVDVPGSQVRRLGDPAQDHEETERQK
jgi:hypothetical protein